jgi:hypothetical protein
MVRHLTASNSTLCLFTTYIFCVYLSGSVEHQDFHTGRGHMKHVLPFFFTMLSPKAQHHNCKTVIF